MASFGQPLFIGGTEELFRRAERQWDILGVPELAECFEEPMWGESPVGPLTLEEITKAIGRPLVRSSAKVVPVPSPDLEIKFRGPSWPRKETFRSECGGLVRLAPALSVRLDADRAVLSLRRLRPLLLTLSGLGKRPREIRKWGKW